MNVPAQCKICKTAEQKLEQKVRLELQNEGDRQPLMQFLDQCNLDGVGSKRLAWVMEGNSLRLIWLQLFGWEKSR